MDLWHGDIAVDHDHQSIQDLHFSHPHVQDTPIPQDASLRFLAIVETADVPLYLAAGPSLDVWTSNERTQGWLHGCLIEDEDNDNGAAEKPWWERSEKQSRYGILLGVKNGSDEVDGKGLTITEVLLYAASSNPSQQGYASTSPPASSSPSLEGLTIGRASTIRLYALPLSSHILKTLEQLRATSDPSVSSTDQGPFLLPSIPDSAPQLEDSRVHKRPKIETLFDDATKNRRLQKKRGGEGIAKAMAGIDNKATPPAISSPAIPNATASKGKPPSTRTPLSRASTTGSLRSTAPATTQAQPSRRAHLISNERSSLHRVESALSPSIDGTNSPVPEEGIDDIEQQNKNSLSRIIMTGMRMYGFQPQRKKSVGAIDPVQSGSQTVSINGGGGGGGGFGTRGQDEYKAVYHQTFKAAVFVFRRYWATRVLGQDLLREEVDGFLARFCGDPFAGGEDGNGLSFQGQRRRSEQAEDVVPGVRQGKGEGDLEMR
ncbi:MAG: hypothetical protein Q9170_005599 [Blastenia crenularia]